jgi:dienelactone hydrolase
MSRSRSLLALVVLLLLSAPVTAQDRRYAARVELHPIQTLTLSDEQFLSGDTGGDKLVTVSGQLRIAQGTGRLPVVVLVHGSGGMGANIELWANELGDLGISSFALDGFTGRDLMQVSTDQAQLGRLNLIVDAYRALGILAKHPRVDGSRVALMGFSRGGQAARYASLARFHRAWNTSAAEFAGYVPFYPDCMTTYLADTDVADRPIRIHHGTPDDYNPVAPCKRYVERLRAAGRDVQLTEYPNAQHAFDGPLLQPTLVAKNSQTVRRCVIREESGGRLVNTATGNVFSYADACVERDPHVGHDPVATRAAVQSVRELLKTVFKL